MSTLDQNPELQEDDLRRAGCEKIYTDRASGAKTDRPELDQAIHELRKGDMLVVWKLDRLGRSLKHLIEIVTDLEKRKIGFRSLQESIDTTTSGGKLIFHVFGALAEFERDLIQERTKAGLRAARARGRNGGRPRSLSAEQIKQAQTLMGEKHRSVKDICQTLSVSRATLYRYVSDENGIGLEAATRPHRGRHSVRQRPRHNANRG